MKRVLGRLTLRWEAWIGGLLLALMLGAALLGPLLAPYPFDAIRPTDSFQPPSSQHLFGADDLGRDLYSRVLVGARISLAVGLAALTLALGLGSLLGLVSGFVGGWADTALMGLVEVLLAFPGILLALVIGSILGPGLSGAALAIGLAGAPGVARLVRSMALTVRGQDYVLAARALGVPSARILLLTVLPNVAGSIIALATVFVPGVLLAAAGLAFIGLGAQPPVPEWGALLAAGRLDLAAAPWLAIFPGLALFLTVLGAILFGQALRDALDPRI